MIRREFMTLIGGMTVGWPLAARAQQTAMPIVGFLSSRSPDESEVHAAAFRQGLSEAGFVDGRNVAIVYRWAEGHYERLSGLASELVGLRVSVMVTVGGSVAALAAKPATAAIPIVFVVGDDPVKLGIVDSFNRPASNLTGVAWLTGELGSKRLGLLCELLPDASAVGFLLNPTAPEAEAKRLDVETAANSLGRRLVVLHASSEPELEQSFAMMAREHIGALVVANDPFFDSRRDRLVALAARTGIAAIYHIRDFPAAGGLMSYGASLADAYRQAGSYAGRILRGEKPADLPVIQPTRFELVINLKTAKALRLTLTPSLLARADEVIE